MSSIISKEAFIGSINKDPLMTECLRALVRADKSRKESETGERERASRRQREEIERMVTDIRNEVDEFLRKLEQARVLKEQKQASLRTAAHMTEDARRRRHEELQQQFEDMERRVHAFCQEKEEEIRQLHHSCQNRSDERVRRRGEDHVRDSEIRLDEEIHTASDSCMTQETHASWILTPHGRPAGIPEIRRRR